MANIPTIAELLQPLGARLADIEGLRISPLEGNDFNYKAILIPLERSILVLNPAESIPAIKKMFFAIDDILERKIADYTANNAIANLPFVGNEIAETADRIVVELNFYQDVLDNLHAKAQPVIWDNTNGEQKVACNIVEIPADFVAEDFLKAGFDPVLSEKEAAYLLSILRQLKYAPHYSNLSMGRVALILFGRSHNTVRTALGQLDDMKKYPENLEHLRALKNRLQRMIEVIDDRLKP